MTTACKEHPILFSAPMVRALLAGTKTQTRRAIAIPRRGAFVLMGDDERSDGGPWWPYQSDDGESSTCDDGCEHRMNCPYGQPGDRLWVREAFAIESTQDYEGDPGIAAPLGPVKVIEDDGYRLIPRYRASEPDTQLMIAPSEKDDIGMRWKPSIHMPRWASHILLAVTDVRVERLQDISEADALAEGIVRLRDGGYGLADTTHYHYTDPRNSYWSLWESINGAGSVEANPWVWAVSFKQVQAGKEATP